MPRTVTYEYYTDEYHGTAVPEEEWDHAALLASAHLDRVKALARVTPLGDEAECESMAICAMAEVFDAWIAATTGSAGVGSEQIGSVSVRYAGAADVMPEGLGPTLMASVRPWLHVCLVVG